MDGEQSTANGPEAVDVLAEEFLARYRRGERPSITDYATKCPDMAEEIRELFPALAVLERLGPQPDDLSTRAINTTIGGAIPRQLGEYQLLREVGRGGMGIVYEAEPISLGRRVALKVLPAHAVLSGSLLTRFQNEAKAAARLHHTNIVSVFGVGEDQGLHYYATQFIQGQGLDAVLGELRRMRKDTSSLDSEEPGEPPVPRLDAQPSEVLAKRLIDGHFSDPSSGATEGPAHWPTPVSPQDVPSESLDTLCQAASADLSSHSTSDSAYFRSVARMGLQVAEALTHAHSQGVLHRDIKPSNLLLDALGCVWVTDFGLAKQEGSDLTRSGDVVGTLRYLAPERFQGKSDARTDI